MSFLQEPLGRADYLGLPSAGCGGLPTLKIVVDAADGVALADQARAMIDNAKWSAARSALIVAFAVATGKTN